MRRSVARGRVVPQWLSTDRRIGRLCWQGKLLFPFLWVNGDDQGRLSGESEEIKYTACPSVPELTIEDIPKYLKQMEDQLLIFLYDTPRGKAIQFIDWWDVQKLQWAYPSEFPPRNGWNDRLRYKRGRKHVITVNWAPEQLPLDLDSSGEHSGESSGESSGALPHPPPPPPPLPTQDNERGRGRGKRRAPECSGEHSGELSSPSPVVLELENYFSFAFGRQPDSRERAFIRDIGTEISAAGVTTEQIHDAFKEAVGHNKMHLSYVAKILRQWLGLEHNRSP